MSKPPFNVYTTPFGMKCFLVKERNNVFGIGGHKKEYMTDAEGKEWYRYVEPIWSAEVIPVVFSGRITYKKEGDIGNNTPDEDVFVFSYDGGARKGHVEIYGTDDSDWDDVFLFEDAAWAEAKRIVKEKNAGHGQFR